MFGKEKSSLQSDQKKGKDVTLRKSDRRELLQRVYERFGLSLDKDDDVVVDDNHNKNIEDKESLPDQDRNIKAILRQVFLQGNLTQRTLVATESMVEKPNPSQKKKREKKIWVYYRGPQDTTTTTTTLDMLWPFQKLTQPVWIEMESDYHSHVQNNNNNNNKNRPKQQQQQQSPPKLLGLPTVALLTAFRPWTTTTTQPFLPIVTVYPPVSKYICRGAHLMKAGIANITLPTAFSPSSFSTVVAAVCIQGNPQPFAVGYVQSDWISSLLVSSSSSSSQHTTAAASFGPGTQGIAVHVETCYGDDLWRQQLPSTTTLSSTLKDSLPFDRGHYGNEGFLDGEVVVPILSEEMAIDTANPETTLIHDSVDPMEGQADENNQSQDENNPSEDDDESDPPHLTEETDATTTTTTTAIQMAEGDTNDADNIPETTVAEEMDDPTNDDIPESNSLSPEDILHQAVCRALANLHPKRDLPMNMATFYAQHVLNPGGHDLPKVDLKRTRYKKFGNYIQEQVDQNLIQVSAKDNNPLALLVGYNPRHVDLIPWIQQRKQQKEGAEEDDESSPRKFVLVDLYCVPQRVVTLLQLEKDVVKAANASSEERKNTGLLTVKEVRAILEDYVEKQQLIDPQKQGRVLLNGPLTDALYKQHTKKDAEAVPPPPPLSLTRKELMSVWQDKMETAYALVEMPGNRVIRLGRGHPPKVTVEVLQRQSKKYVTKIRGLEFYGISSPEFRQLCATRLACAATVEETNHGEVLLQGNWADSMEALLVGDPTLSNHGGVQESPFHLPSKAIDVVLRKGVPPRKKKGPPQKKNW